MEKTLSPFPFKFPQYFEAKGPEDILLRACFGDLVAYVNLFIASYFHSASRTYRVVTSGHLFRFLGLRHALRGGREIFFKAPDLPPLFGD